MLVKRPNYGSKFGVVGTRCRLDNADPALELDPTDEVSSSDESAPELTRIHSYTHRCA